MRGRLTLAVLGLTCVPALAFGGGFLSLYSDAALTQCSLSDVVPGTANVYLTELPNGGATGSRFRVAASPGFTGVWLSETSPFTTIGNSQTDLSVGFGNCRDGRFVVLTMTYQLYGTSECSQLSFTPALGQTELYCLDCSFGMECNGLYPLYVNCSGSHGCDPLPVESTTWGSVKALYRN